MLSTPNEFAPRRNPASAARVYPKTGVNAKPPHKYKVVVFNDDTTPADFILNLFFNTFGLTRTQALIVLDERKYNGNATVIVAPWEIAEQKVAEARREIAHFGFLLEINMYPL